MMALPVLLVCTAFATDVVTEGIQTAGRTTANPGCTVTYDAVTGKYTASTTSGIKAGKEYVLLVVKADGNGNALPINDESVMYIDQKAADANGVSFDFIPRSTPDCVLKLGGEFSEGTSPVTLGTLVGKSGVTVSGSVSYLGSVTKPIIKLTSGSTEYMATVAEPVNETSTFTFDSVAIGDYTLSMTKKGHKALSMFVSVTNADITVEKSDLLGGDVDADGGVTLSDLSSVLTAFGKSGDAIINKGNDIDEDNGITLTDLSITLTNFGK